MPRPRPAISHFLIGVSSKPPRACRGIERLDSAAVTFTGNSGVWAWTEHQSSSAQGQGSRSWCFRFTRKLKLGRPEILVKHVPRWMLTFGIGPAGAAVRALAWMGPTHASESLVTLRRTLPRAEWCALASARAALPS